MPQRLLNRDPSPHFNLETEDLMAVVRPIEVTNSLGVAYTVSRVNPLYIEDIEGIMSPTADSYNETYSLRRGKHLRAENNIKSLQPAYDVLPGTKQLMSPENHGHFEVLKRGHSLPPRLRAKRLRNGHHWLGFNIIHVSAEHVSSIAVNRALKVSRNELQVPSIVRSSKAINAREHELNVRINSEFVKNISSRTMCRKKHNCPALRIIHNSEFVKNVLIICMHSKKHEAQSANNVQRSEDHRYRGTDHVTVQPARSDGDDEENCLDSIVTNSLLEMTSREPSPVSSLSRHCSQEPILKQTCWNEEAGQSVLQELSQAISHCEPVTRLQKVSGDFKICSPSDSSQQLSGFAQTGKCSPQQESASPLSLVIRLFRGQSSTRREQEDTIDADEEEQNLTTDRRKSWFQRWSSHRKRSQMSEDSGSGSPDSNVKSVLEVADLRDIIIHPTRSDKLAQAATSSNTQQHVSTETDPYKTGAPIPTERHVSFSIGEDNDTSSKSKKVWQQSPAGGAGPVSVESLIRMLSDKSATESDREKLWNHFYSSQASDAQLTDKKMLRSWQAARQAKDRNLSAFTLDFGRAVSLRRQSVKRRRVRKACHMFTILLVIMSFIGIIVLVSWLGSGGRKLFGSL